ncbi:hypothetical protein CDV31_016454 [Fusarium ambrosium]|uniref:SGNH hydrolase-type esterase domain-containing protein n=1 Tax=Fusarium ambrosium TaxID=131363 RepID=A0A428S8A5_9HYPO|nr:hypothetical protein CDV31_016454 [Fusarium ambrosium]
MLRPLLSHRPLLSGTGASKICSTCNNVYLPSIAQHGQFSQLGATKKRLRLMPVGGSITYGVGSSDGNGYRQFLGDMLRTDGYQVQFVGSRRSGSMDDSNNEGWRGYRIDQINSQARKCVPTLLPQVFAINAGSNDCIQDFQMETLGLRMNNMLEFFWQANPSSVMILSTLLVNRDKDVNTRVMRANDQFRQLVELKTREGKKLVLADMDSSRGPQLDDLVDGTHPNDHGYKKMATIWFGAVQRACEKRFI